jgi:hypothetical protein
MKRKLTLTDLLIIAILLAASHGLAYAVTHSTPVQASGGPVARPAPTCDDAPKAGTVELSPGGTMNAMEQVTFTIPFCADNLVAFATVDNGNTAGEATGAKPWGVGAVNVSMELDAPSSDVYTVYWRVEPVTQ